MKIIYDTLIFNAQRFGGASTVFNEIFKRNNLNNIDYGFLISDLPIVNYDFKHIDFSKCFFLKEKCNNYQLLKNTNPSIEINTNYDSQNSYIYHSTFLRTSKNKKIKSVVTIHDFTHQYFFHGLRKLINYNQKRNAVRNADGIICVSENTKKDLLHFFPNVDLNKVVVIYNSADEIFKPNKISILPQEIANILSNNPYVLFVGDRSKYKRFDFFCKVFTNWTLKLDLVIVGGKQLSNSEKQLLNETRKKWSYFSNLDSNTLSSLYLNAFFLFYPSEYEGFGIPVLEAMKCGCPVVAMNRSSIPEVSLGSCILLDGYNLENARKEIMSLYDSNNRSKISLREIEKSDCFSWDESYKKLLSFYNMVLHQNDN